MNPQRLKRHTPFEKMATFVLIVSVSVQLVVIIYNHLSGFSVITGIDHFIVRFLFGTVLTMIGGFIVTLPDLWVIAFLNKKLPWSGNIFLRVFIQLIFAVVIAVIVTTLITLLSHAISPYKEGLISALRVNWLITSVINIIVMAICEALVYFNESKKAKLEAEQLEKEMFHIRYEVLKNQINPHFMFNSLNVLSGLIEKDTKKAQLFIDDFAHIYRYVLDTIEKVVVPLQDELNFVKSYISLQRIRYGKALNLQMNINGQLINAVLPPLSLQLVLENAIKHNAFSNEDPLFIKIYNDVNGKLIIENNIRRKVSAGVSTGLGQNNLIKRYKMISEQIPVFTVKDSSYFVTLPLLKDEDDKSSDY